MATPDFTPDFVDGRDEDDLGHAHCDAWLDLLKRALREVNATSTKLTGPLKLHLAATIKCTRTTMVTAMRDEKLKNLCEGVLAIISFINSPAACDEFIGTFKDVLKEKGGGEFAMKPIESLVNLINTSVNLFALELSANNTSPIADLEAASSGPAGAGRAAASTRTLDSDKNKQLLKTVKMLHVERYPVALHNTLEASKQAVCNLVLYSPEFLPNEPNAAAKRAALRGVANFSTLVYQAYKLDVLPAFCYACVLF